MSPPGHEASLPERAQPGDLVDREPDRATDSRRYTPAVNNPGSEVDPVRLVGARRDDLRRTRRRDPRLERGRGARVRPPRGRCYRSTLDVIVPEQFRGAHWAGWARALAERKTKYVGQSVPTRAERADGTPITVELSFAIVLGDDEASIGALATARDISERWEPDRATLRRLCELEAELEEPSDNAG